MCPRGLRIRAHHHGGCRPQTSPLLCSRGIPEHEEAMAKQSAGGVSDGLGVLGRGGRRRRLPIQP